ncbi:MAG: hypothetical protein ACKVQS_00125 [Fimbriimonadaceae bacterium]
MSLASFAAGMIFGQQAPLREIKFQDGFFTLNGPEGSSKVSIRPGFQAMNTSTGRLWLPVGGHILTFDEKGVGFRKSNRATYATYASIATSNKIFTKAEIDEINRDVANNRKSLDVSAVSGWEKVGETAYVMLRWDDKQSKPWLEVLMRYDFTGGKPRATYLGKFDSHTGARGRVNDKMIFENGKLLVVTHGSETSLLETFDVSSKEFGKTSLQDHLVDSKLIEGSLYGIGVTPTPAKTFLVSLIDREKGKSQRVAEIRGSIQDLFAPAILKYASNDRTILLSLTTGAEIVIPNNCGIEAVPSGMLLWTPSDQPKTAALYSSGSFRTLARWSKP